MVNIGDVKADALGIWSVVEHEGKDRLVHVYGIAYLTNAVDRGIRVDGTDEYYGLGNVNGIDNQFLVIGVAVYALLVYPVRNVILFQHFAQAVGRFFVLTRITDEDFMLHTPT